MHGKMPVPLIFPQIEGMEEVKKIFDEVLKEKSKENTGGKKG